MQPLRQYPVRQERTLYQHFHADLCGNGPRLLPVSQWRCRLIRSLRGTQTVPACVESEEGDVRLDM